MIAAQEHLGNLPTTEIRGSGVLRAIEHAFFAKRFLEGRILVPENARQQPCNAIDDYGGGKLASAQDEIADREFFVDEMFGHALVDAFVSAAYEKQLAAFGKASSSLLIEALALSR